MLCHGIRENEKERKKMVSDLEIKPTRPTLFPANTRQEHTRETETQPQQIGAGSIKLNMTRPDQTNIIIKEHIQKPVKQDHSNKKRESIQTFA